MYKLVEQKNKALRKKTKQVFDFRDPKLKKLVAEMKETMKKEQGIGLATPQIGKSLAIFVIDIELIKELEDKKQIKKSRGFQKIKRLLKRKVPEVYINPKIKDLSKRKFLMDEGCLSVPGVFGIVSRPEKLTVEAQNENGKKFKLKAKGLVARVIQHEVDHLNGVLFVEKAMKETLYRIKTKN